MTPAPLSTSCKRRAEIGAMVRLHVDMIGEHRRLSFVRELTVTPAVSSVSFGPKLKDEEGNTIPPPGPEPIKLWHTDYATMNVFVPFRWGMNFIRLNHLPYDLKLSGGDLQWKPARLPDPNHPSASPGQAIFFDEVYREVMRQGAILIEAPTGSGKTVTLLNTIGKLGHAALVIVPSKALADQWVLEAKRHLGLEHEDIGLIQGAHARWKGCKVTIAVIHNLFMKEWSPEFYQYFGTVCWDEVHRLGAPEFSKTMPLFSACRRIGATATPDRKDGCMAVVTRHLGEVAVRHSGDALASECRVIDFCDPFAHKYAKLPLPILLKILVKNKARNETITDAVLRMYRRDRNILILSDRIEHLQTLQTMAHQAGVPNAVTALYVGSFKVGGKTKTTGQGYLREIRENPQYRVIFATYAMMKEGTDIPRLDAGIDATPRADAVQAFGRIRRPLPGKPVPVWFTLLDSGVPLLCGFAKARLRELSNTNVTIIQ